MRHSIGVDRLAVHGGAPVRRRLWPAWPEFGAPEREALERVLESRRWGGFPSPGPEAAELVREFAAFTGARGAVPCANGTVSLLLALQAARVSPGAEVITTAYTFVGTASAIVRAGCVPVFVDVLPDTYCLDPDAVAAAVGPRTEAILPVHLACALADLDRLGEIRERHGLLLVEDCAHAHGARWCGRAVGTLGDAGSFSMQSSKLLTAGEGGIVTTQDPVLEQRLWSLVNCGRKEPGSDGFPERLLGHNFRMTEWQAAILRAQLRRLPEQNARRARNVERLEAELASLPGLRPLARDPRVTERTAYQVVLRYDPDAFAGVPRDHAVLALRAEGIPCNGRFYVPLPEDPLFPMDPLTNPLACTADLRAWPELPVARRAAHEESLWLPHELFLGDEEDVRDLVAAFEKLRARVADLRDRPPAGDADR